LTEIKANTILINWMTTEDFMRHQPGYDAKYDDIFANAFDTITILSGTYHVVKQLS